jgi:hypothetical protein
MKRLLLAGCLSVLLVGCAEPDATEQTTTLDLRPADAQVASGTTIKVPGDANMTIFCAVFTGPNHPAAAAEAKMFATAAMQQEPGVTPEFYVIQHEDRSILYHGFYETDDPIIDRRAAARAARDKDVIERMGIAGPEGGQVPAFPMAIFKPIPKPDPVAPAEFDLRNSNAFWTVAIAVYTDPATRKRAAVESVIAAREQNVPAYFLHEGNFSYVTIGAWPREAVAAGRTSEELNELGTGDDTMDPRLMVVSPGGLPEHLKNVTDSRGRQAVSMEVQIEVRDPTLLATMKRYDYDVDGFTQRPEPLLVNVPETLKIRVDQPVDTSAFTEDKDEEMLDLLQRPPGL